MNFVKKLFHNQQQQQQRRVSNSHRHAAAAGSTTAITSSTGSTSTNTSASIPLAAAAGTAGTDAATVTFSTSGQQQLQLVNKHHKKTKRSRRQHPQRLRRTTDEGDNDVQDDNAVDASHEPEKNGNAWKLSPFSSPGNSPSRRQDRTGYSTGGRQVLRLDTDATDTESASVSGGSRAGTPTSTGRITTSKATATATTPGSSRSGIVLESATTPTDVVTREIKMASCRHVALVLPNLLLGSQEIANDLRGLRHYNVTHVLNVTVEVPDRFPDKFVYKRIAISDMPSAKLVPHFDDAFRFIDMARSTPGDGCVLVHCYYGNSRSASFVIGYLMVAERMRYVDALRYLQLLRPGVRPNDGFQRQLKHYETTAVKSLRQQSAVAAAAAAAIASDAAAAAAVTTSRQTASSGGR